MPRSALGKDGQTDDLPIHMRRARGQDRSWVTQSRCRVPGVLGDLTSFAQTSDDELFARRHAWTIDASEGAVVIAGRKLDAAQVEQACVTICRSCPVQGDCIRYAVNVVERAGTWAAPLRLVLWLQRHPDQLDEVVGQWEAFGTPITASLSFLAEFDD